MSTLRKRPLKDLLCHETEKPVLEQLYLQHRVATDQLRRCPAVLKRLTDQFNAAVGRDYSESLLLRYMVNRRKQTDWPNLGTTAIKLANAAELLSSTELLVLQQIYLEIDRPSDELLFESSCARLVSKRFREETGRAVAGSILVAVIIAKRKRREWLCIRDDSKSAFSDIGLIG